MIGNIDLMDLRDIYSSDFSEHFAPIAGQEKAEERRFACKNRENARDTLFNESKAQGDFSETDFCGKNSEAP